MLAESKCLKIEKELVQTKMERAREKDSFQKAELELHSRLKEIGDRLKNTEEQKTELKQALDKVKKELEDLRDDQKITVADNYKENSDTAKKDDTEASVINSPI